MFTEDSNNGPVAGEQGEFDFYLQFEWPEHIETALRRMLFVSFVEAAEGGNQDQPHTHFLRFNMAAHPDTPAAVLDYLSQFDDTSLLVRVAENSATSAKTLEKLAQNARSEVAIAIADNPATPLTVLLKMLESSDVDLRYSMAENPGLPAAFLQKLSEDENPYVGARASKTLQRRSPASVQELPIRQQQQRKTS